MLFHDISSHKNLCKPLTVFRLKIPVHSAFLLPVPLILISIPVHLLIVVLVLTAYDSLPPLAVVEIPMNRLFYAVLKLCFREPTKLSMGFRRVDGIAHIVTFSVGDVCDEAFRLAELFTNQLHDVNIAHFVMPADVVDLSNAPVVNNQVNRLTVIFNIEPVAHVFTLAVDGQRFVVQAVGDYQRDQLLREVVRAVVIGTS